MHWVERRSAKANLAEALMRHDGWVVKGYEPDKSDSMTDYYDPATWDGIAVRDGYILVVDQTHNTNPGINGCWHCSKVNMCGVQFSGNPPHKIWHIEKDGVIIDSGVGLKGCFDWNKKEESMAYTDKLIDRFEKIIENHKRGKSPSPITVVKGEIRVVKDGHWTWIYGDTYPHKERLKEQGFRWSGNRKGWYNTEGKEPLLDDLIAVEIEEKGG